MLIRPTGRTIREPKPFRFQRRHQTESPRLLEPAQTSPLKPRLLRPPLFCSRRNRDPRPKQLRRRKLLPRRPSPSPSLSWREMHLFEPRSHPLHRRRRGERSERIPRTRWLRRASKGLSLRLARPLLRPLHAPPHALVLTNTHRTGRSRARTASLLDAETPLQHPAAQTQHAQDLGQCNSNNGPRSLTQIRNLASRRRRRRPPGAETQTGIQPDDST